MAKSRVTAQCAARVEFSSHEWFTSAREPVRCSACPWFMNSHIFLKTFIIQFQCMHDLCSRLYTWPRKCTHHYCSVVQPHAIGRTSPDIVPFHLVPGCSCSSYPKTLHILIHTFDIINTKMWQCPFPPLVVPRASSFLHTNGSSLALSACLRGALVPISTCVRGVSLVLRTCMSGASLALSTSVRGASLALASPSQLRQCMCAWCFGAYQRMRERCFASS